MKSLIKKSRRKAADQTKVNQAAAPKEKVVAQCCAKVSKVVAGCHD